MSKSKIVTEGPSTSAYCSDAFKEGVSCQRAVRSTDGSSVGRTIMSRAVVVEPDALAVVVDGVSDGVSGESVDVLTAVLFVSYC